MQIVRVSSEACYIVQVRVLKVLHSHSICFCSVKIDIVIVLLGDSQMQKREKKYEMLMRCETASFVCLPSCVMQ